MEYYFLSLITSLVIFIIIQFLEYTKKQAEIKNNENYYIEPYSLFKIGNLILFIIIYIVFTVGFYYIYNSDLNNLLFSNVKAGNKEIKQEIKEDIDPKVLSKINDNFEIGFEPFGSDVSDAKSSISSLSTTSIED